jgi:hypothetical protein
MRIVRLLPLLVLVAVPVPPGHAQTGPDAGGSCPPDVVVALREACPCDGDWPSQTRYRRCTRAFTKRLRRAGCVTSEALRTAARCARRSVCGPRGGVRCCQYRFGVCDDPAPGDGVVAGVCSEPAGRACDVDLNCTSARTRRSRSAAACAERGGVAAPGGACDPCPLERPQGELSGPGVAW